MIRLELHEGRVVLPVQARAGARREGIQGEQNGMLKVAVTQVAERGKANRAITKVLSKELRLRGAQIHLIGGETSPQKRFLIAEIKLEELAARIAAILPRR